MSFRLGTGTERTRGFGRGAVARSLISLVALAFLSVTQSALAHEVRPAYLDITEQPAGHYRILWKQPTIGDRAVLLVPHLSSGWLEAAPTEVDTSAHFTIKVWHATGRAPLHGQTLTLDGLDQTMTDVLVSATLANGAHFQEIVQSRRPALRFEFGTKPVLPVSAYLRLGIEHLLGGIDHLLFVLGLILLVRGKQRLLFTITAFTLAHSLTLALATLGWVNVQPARVEVFIALSMVFVAVEGVRFYRGRPGMTARFTWAVAFAFGLLHGLAFAGALSNVGLPRDAIPQSLFLFNVGVEMGQLIFVALALTGRSILRRLPWPLPYWAKWIPPYAISSFAAFWLIDCAAVVLR